MKAKYKIIKDILQSEYFIEKPPVLVDIGASEEINVKWKVIAPFSICLAFDADDRDFKVTETGNSSFKRLIKLNRIVESENKQNQLFYLTASPYCSSLLEPDEVGLKPWLFSKLFKVEKHVELPAMMLDQALEISNIKYIDWFKSDTQGTDLKIFKSLKDTIVSNILAAEFEPGIIDAYKNEDKLYTVMSHMASLKFWLSNFDLKGTQRLNSKFKETFSEQLIRKSIKTSPCWGELTYLREVSNDLNERQLLLLCVFAIIEGQYGYVLEITDFSMRKFKTDIFTNVHDAILKYINKQKLKLPFLIAANKLNKLIDSLHD